MPFTPKFDLETPVQELSGDDIVDQMLFLAQCQNEDGEVEVDCPGLPIDMNLTARLSNLIGYVRITLMNRHLQGESKPRFVSMPERR